MKICLTIAGSDASGGAGIQADLKTFAAHGIYGMSVIVAVVAENTCEVRSVMDVSPQVIRDQIDCVMTDIPPDAVKIGMLSSQASMQAVADGLAAHRPKNVVIDPVMLAKDGSELMAPEALTLFKTGILPHATVFTPNIPEAEVLTGMTIRTEEDMRKAAKILLDMGAQTVLVKGGHL
ncbi:MAG: bifunctional hydroxymethylpyrimidine kinase/phosphomethylpyrimidine kinase, partial [Clostridiales bacterium]|nr:bifunctional hydroxymethylpyrimidine kinase/phosphomethylpyrimidine kinase [Clostridiales bacterium]